MVAVQHRLRPRLARRAGPAARRDRALRGALRQRLLGRVPHGVRRRRRHHVQPVHHQRRRHRPRA
nr:hypothetical protein [Angustibacter aerolatus]